jgi:uncharacterized protein YbjT (DUF2867 family)
MRVLITGGAGNLGSKVAAGLVQGGHSVRAMSRNPDARIPEGSELAVADLVSGEGVTAAVHGVDAIVHCASSPFRKEAQTDVEGTEMLLELLAREPGNNKNFFYISIVGVDGIPFSYYKSKLAAEKIVSTSRVPWTILRATQFHEFLDRIYAGLTKLPVVPFFSGFRFQLLDAQECADHMVELVESGPAGRVPEIGGPEVLEMREIAARWLAATGKRRLKVPVPVPGGFGGAMRAGLNLAPDARLGRRTFDEWLAARYGAGR